MITATSIFYFVVLIFSIMVHEVAHGLMAEHEGDPTARNLGRITLNPLKHIDWLGSVILPIILILTNAGFIVGWAKPVPYTIENLRNGRKSEAKVAMAGVIVNLSIALFFGIIIRAAVAFHYGSIALISGASIIVLLNIVLALFNSIPLAPLDGFRFLSAVLPARTIPTMRTIERLSLPLLLLFIVFGWNFVSPVVFKLFSLLTGIAVPL
ncbi:MAG: putative peptidase family [Candidatus Nomurabacteria bacterium]|nr:putative peptidase family [Candidatus Nomurabacteria bacterium]